MTELVQTYVNGNLRFSREFTDKDKLDDFIKAEMLWMVFSADLSVDGMVTRIDGQRVYSVFGVTK